MGQFATIQGQTPSTPATTPPSFQHDGEHDFDFELGIWKTHLKGLRHPLTGAFTWVEYEGTSVVHSIWAGHANMVELEVDGPTGHVEAINLRLYSPTSHRRSLSFANAAAGTIGVSTVDEFRDGRGEFCDQEAVNDGMILVRNIWSDIIPNSCHFEQAFSDDSGKTWETNRIADDTRDLNIKTRSASWQFTTFRSGFPLRIHLFHAKIGFGSGGAELLRSTNKPVSNIAVQFDFRNTSSFQAHFGSSVECRWLPMAARRMLELLHLVAIWH